MKSTPYRSGVIKSIGIILPMVLILGGCAGQPGYQSQVPPQPILSEPAKEMVTSSLASISNIEVKGEDNAIRIVIKGSGPFTYNVFQREAPLRLVVDVAKAKLDAPIETLHVGQGVITEVWSSEVDNSGEPTTRIEIGLNTSGVNYEVVPSGNELSIYFPVMSTQMEPVKKAEGIVDVAINDSGSFVQVDIIADGKVEDYNAFPLKEPARLVLDLPGLQSFLPDKTKECASPLLKKIRYAEHQDHLRIVFDVPTTDLSPFEVVPLLHGITIFLGTEFEEKKQTLMTSAPFGLMAKENSLEPDSLDSPETKEASIQTKEENAPIVVAKAPLSVPMSEGDTEQNPGKNEMLAQKDDPPSSEGTLVGSQSTNTHSQPAQEKEAFSPPAEPPPLNPLVEEEGAGIPYYTGAHISLDFQDADIRNILRLIADVSDLNIVAGDDVQGTVTIKLNDVPWDQALDVILLSNKLGKTLEGNILRVAPLERLNREKQAAIADRETSDKLEPLRKGLIPISYADAKGLKDVIINAKALSPRGSIEIDPRTNTLIVIDIEKNIQEVRYIIDQLDTPTPQVLIDAKVVQINPTYTKELGVTWELEYSIANRDNLIGIGGNQGDVDLGTGELTTTGNIIDLAPAVGQGVGGALSFGFLNPNKFGLFQKIAALEKEEKLEIVSSPRIMTLDNEEAMIEQGVDLPYLKLSEEGVTSTEFKKATLSLRVVPHITADRSILMEIEVKKDQKSAQTGAGGEPGIDTRRAETKILVRNGDTVVIGGIYEEITQDIHNSVPFFGRLPLVSWLFKNTRKAREKTELIVFITPTIIILDKAAQKEVALSSPN